MDSSERQATIANAVLSAVFGAVVLALVVGLALGRLPRAGAIRTYLVLVAAASLLRATQLGIPNSVWGVGETPVEPERFTRPWWGNVARFTLYVSANCANLLQHVWLLRLVDVALLVLHAPASSWFSRAVTAAGIIVVVAQISVAAASFALPYSTVLTASAVLCFLLSLLLLVLLPPLWSRLFDALAVITRHRSKCDALRDSVHLGCGPCCGALCQSSPDEELSLALNDGPQLANARSARAKLSRFTLLAAVTTVESVLKFFFLALTIWLAVTVSGPASSISNAFWIVVAADYLTTEWVLAALTVFILWKPAALAAPPGATARKLSSEVAEEAYGPAVL